ncbi:MAG: DegV family protein [Lachnospiraceae bacterium]|nr:DegV family protein [Lachnospiraceae bacterium]
MNYKIVVDSCCELPEAEKNNPRFQSIPLTLMIDDAQIIDDETFDQKDFIRRVAASPNCPKSACPSPESYMKSYEGGYDCVFVVTLSEQLSGSYNSAVLGKNLFEENNIATKIHVFNSRSASAGETQTALKIEELANAGASFEEIVEQVEAFIEEMNTYFVLETLDTLRKNGRLSNLQAIIANVLSIKPIMGATPEGTIFKLEQARGMNKALTRMAEIVAKDVKEPEKKRLIISHCNCPERAELVKNLILAKISVKETVILDTAGVATMYANDGGVIVTI